MNNSSNSSYREVELPNESFEPYREAQLPNEQFELPWSTYNDLRTRIAELERSLNVAQDTIGDIRTKWKALKAKYDGWITNEEFIALSETLKDVE